MRNPNTKLKGTSTVWDGFIKVYNWLAKDLTWYVGNGQDIIIGIDPILGMEDNYKLFDDILSYLRNCVQ